MLNREAHLFRWTGDFARAGFKPVCKYLSTEIVGIMGMKKLGVICVVLCLLIGMVGCFGQGSEPWQGLTYHVTSSVMTEGCHFSLTRDESGSMYLTGYCFEDSTEYRLDEAKQISSETKETIDAMALDNATKAKQKPFGVADGTQISITLTYPNGTERRISLSADQRIQLRQLLQKELIGK